MTHAAMTPFVFEGENVVRALSRLDAPWFVLTDLCKVLDIGNSSDAARRLDDDEKGVDIIDTPGGPQEMVVINESGLYSLVLTSRKPAAKRFKKWVTAEVLPSIRRTGSYAVASGDTVAPVAPPPPARVSGRVTVTPMPPPPAPAAPRPMPGSPAIGQKSCLRPVPPPPATARAPRNGRRRGGPARAAA